MPPASTPRLEFLRLLHLALQTQPLIVGLLLLGDIPATDHKPKDLAIEIQIGGIDDFHEPSTLRW